MKPGWPNLRNRMPQSLRSRIFAILLSGLAIAYALSFSVFFVERYMSAKAMMLGTLESDLATSIAVIDRLPAGERASWLDRLSRGNYRLILGPGLSGAPDMTVHGAEIARKMQEAAGPASSISVMSIPGEAGRLQGHLTLSDGSPLTIDVTPTGVMPMAVWLPYVLAAQMVVLILCAWFAVRQAMRPLADLSEAVSSLDPNRPVREMPESGPREVAQAAQVFNAMRRRISDYLEERVQILAAISHDLQTPITRMRLRADIADDTPEKEKLVKDLLEIERLVQDGIAYARSSHGASHKMSRIDLKSFIDSIVYDYSDTGKSVAIAGYIQATIVTNPHALRRILTNLIDNAIKFGGDARIEIRQPAGRQAEITVTDRGPGIPEEMLHAVLQPFFRLERSRNRETGGTGLGLAIAHQLTGVIGGSLRLYNRANGGLAAEITI